MADYGFHASARVTHLDGELWRLRAPLRYRSRGCDRYPELRDLLIEVPAGFVFDGASIPRLAWSLMPSKAATIEEGALHDWPFRFGPHLRPAIGFAAANWLLWESLEISDEGWAAQRWAMWSAVATGGGLAWWRWRRADLRPIAEALRVYDPREAAWPAWER